MARQRANYPNGTLLHEYEVVQGRLENQVFRVDRTQDVRRALGPLVTFDVGLLPDTAAFVRRVAGASPLAYEIFDADDVRLDREGRRAGGPLRPGLAVHRRGRAGETANEALARYAAFLEEVPLRLRAWRALCIVPTTATVAQVRAAEARLGRALPRSYVEHVTRHGSFSIGLDATARLLLPDELRTVHDHLEENGLVEEVVAGASVDGGLARLLQSVIVSRVPTPDDAPFHCLRFDRLEEESGEPAVVRCHEDHVQAWAEPVGPTERCFGLDAHVASVVDDWIDDYVAGLEEPFF